MTERLSIEQYRALQVKPRKYRNRPTQAADGRTYDSRLEARYAAELEQQRKAGLIRAVIPQVSIPVPGTTKRMRLDFLVIDHDGTCRWVDTKGPPPTRAWLLKQELCERAYGIRVELIRSA